MSDRILEIVFFILVGVIYPLLMILSLTGCNGEWTETYESESNCSACYVVDDPLRGEGLVCTNDANYTNCSGLLIGENNDPQN